MTVAILRAFIVLLLFLSYSSFTPTASLAQDSQNIQLSAVTQSGGKPLLTTLAERKSTRSFKPDPISDKQLSELLWAAVGITRPDGKRTIPTARGQNEIEVYAVLPTGVYHYNPEKNILELVLAGNFSKEYGNSYITLLFAAPNNVMGGLHAGSAYQNTGLYCASEGLANVVKISGTDALKGKLSLPNNYEILVVQSIGIPG
ncbi:MAG: nitroreductase family protein [Deltaproteobacteria bacterium]|jgi:hypothetical protein|nr:nitroreductase family protein [Deltaproteobacteria bacterium]